MYELDYQLAFTQGTDTGTDQDVAILALSGLVSFNRGTILAGTTLDGPHQIPSKHLIAEFAWGEGDEREELVVIIAHFRAGANVAQRQRQARAVRFWTDEAIAAGKNVIVLGDFNTGQRFAFTSADSEIGILRGLGTADTDDDLEDLHRHLPAEERATHLNGDEYDRILASQAAIVDDAGAGV